jgi:hypothetical protein
MRTEHAHPPRADAGSRPSDDVAPVRVAADTAGAVAPVHVGAEAGWRTVR